MPKTRTKELKGPLSPEIVARRLDHVQSLLICAWRATKDATKDQHADADDQEAIADVLLFASNKLDDVTQELRGRS